MMPPVDQMLSGGERELAATRPSPYSCSERIARAAALKRALAVKVVGCVQIACAKKVVALALALFISTAH